MADIHEEIKKKAENLVAFIDTMLPHLDEVTSADPEIYAMFKTALKEAVQTKLKEMHDEYYYH